MIKKFRCTKPLIRFGDASWAVTLNRHLMIKKGFELGDVVKITIEPFESEDQKKRDLFKLATEISGKEAKKLIVFDEDNIHQTVDNTKNRKNIFAAGSVINAPDVSEIKMGEANSNGDEGRKKI